MDVVDKSILKEMMKKPRSSFIRVSKKINCSSATVQRRFEHMMNDVPVMKITTILDLQKIGFQGKGFLFISGTKNFDNDAVMEKLSKIPNVFHVASVIGNFDILVMVVFKQISDIKKITDRIKSYPGVKKIKMCLTPNVDYPLRKEFFNIALEKELL